MGEQHARARIRQHEGEPLRRIIRIERQIGTARLEDAEKPHDQVKRAPKTQPHHRLRTDPTRAQMMRQPVGTQVELAVGERLLLEYDRNRIGVLCRRAANSSGKVACSTGCAVSFQPRRMVSRSAALRMSIRPSARFGAATARLNEPNEAPRQRLHRHAIELISSEVEAQPQLFSWDCHQTERVMRRIAPADPHEPQAIIILC